MKEKVLPKIKWFFFSYIWIAVLMFIIDITTKSLIVANMKVGESIDLIPGFLRITYEVNYSFAFSSSLGLSPEGVRILYCVIAFLGIGLILFFYIRKYKSHTKMLKACLMLLLVGAIGNLVDRLFYTPEYLGFKYNGVVDWIDFYGIWKYVFNWADSCLVVGAFMLIIYFIVLEIKDLLAKRKESIPNNNEKILSKDELEKEEKLTDESKSKDHHNGE